MRSWYGMFNYGDIMHTYDPFRHSWRYDMGGYAWQNTELVPTLWLWLAFMRSGREDIFTMAEAMSRLLFRSGFLPLWTDGRYRITS